MADIMAHHFRNLIILFTVPCVILKESHAFASKEDELELAGRACNVRRELLSSYCVYKGLYHCKWFIQALPLKLM